MNPTLRRWLEKLGLMPLLYALSPVFTLLNLAQFRHYRQLVRSLPLEPLFERYPRFLYKYLSPYAVASFGRRTRLAVLTHHYQFMAAQAGPAFFQHLRERPVLWRHTIDADEFTIALSFPMYVDYEGELLLEMALNGTVLQLLTFVVAPGAAVGVASEQVLLITHVQGRAPAELMKHARITLHDITPGALLVQAAYGLALAWGITNGAGVGTSEKAGAWAERHFDYDAFWLELHGERSAHLNVYHLSIPAPERPLEEIKRAHRARNQRKREFKKELREQVGQWWQDTFART